MGLLNRERPINIADHVSDVTLVLQEIRGLESESRERFDGGDDEGVDQMNREIYGARRRLLELA